MAWDLWSSTYDPVVHDSNYSEHFGWQCDVYFGFGRDVIEEDALNEKSCVQVLRNLIRTADTEIEKLEKDLLSLQNELAWVEQQKFPEICCSVLTEKINLLEVSIRSLKNDHADNSEIQLLLHNEPAEALHEILKATQRDNCQDKCGQPLDVNMSNLNPSMNISKHAEDQESSNINSNILIKEEQNEVCAENSASSKLLGELLKKRSDCPMKIETANTNVKGSSPGSPKHAAGHPNEEKILTVYNSGGTEEEETKKHIVATEDRSLIENILVCPEEKRCSPEADKELLAKTVMRSPDLGPIICAPGPDRMNRLGTSDLKVLDYEEVRRSQFVASDTVQILNSYSSEVKGNLPTDAKQEDATVKDATAEVFGLAAGIEGRKKCVDTKVQDSQQAISESSDLEQKLCDFAPKSPRRECKKESKVPSTQDLDAMNLPNNRECKRTAPLQVVATQELCLTDPELCSLKGMDWKNSPDVMNFQSAGAYFTGSQLTDEGNSRALCLKSETTTNLSQSVVSLPAKLKNQGKRKSVSDAFATGEPGESPIEVISNSSLNLTSKRQPKRQRKSRASIDGANLDESLNRKVTKRVMQPQPGQHDTEQYAIVVYDSEFSELQKRGNVSESPITVGMQNSFINVELPNSKGVATDKGNPVVDSRDAIVPYDSEFSELQRGLPNSEGVARDIGNPLVDSRDGLKKLTLHTLREIAKQYKVKKYYKLAKGPLVEQLLAKGPLLEQLTHGLSSC